MSSVGRCRTGLLSEFAPAFWEQDEVVRLWRSGLIIPLMAI